MEAQRMSQKVSLMKTVFFNPQNERNWVFCSRKEVELNLQKRGNSSPFQKVM